METKSPSRRRHAHAGFTLVELAVVVTIVGVLAVIAVVAYRKFTMTSKVSEAQNVISAIRIAEEDYRTERGTYLDLSGAPWCPSDGKQKKVYAWSGVSGCTDATGPWNALPVHVDNGLLFGYKVTSAPAAVPNPGWVDMSQAIIQATQKPWYVVQAQADLNRDGGLVTELMGTSFQNTIFSHQEGE